MEENVWRGQVRAPADVVEWLKDEAKDRFTSLNTIIVEALREYQKNRLPSVSEEKKDAAQ